MTVLPEPPIIHPREWGARPPKQSIQHAGPPVRALVHHTAGHHAEIANPADESRAEACRYARDIQAFHMDGRGWIDSGHNFLVCRNGLILVGRHESYDLIRSGRMVVSAHCPGQNTQPGVELEHDGTEQMTGPQWSSAVWLYAWIIRSCRMNETDPPLHGHREFFATDCPSVLAQRIPALKAAVATMLARHR